MDRFAIGLLIIIGVEGLLLLVAVGLALWGFYKWYQIERCR